MTQTKQFEVALSFFKGPFTLLPLLVRKQEVDVQHLSLVEIIDQFCCYLKERKEPYFINSSESNFLSHVTWLHSCKSHSLMQNYAWQNTPPPEEETYDPSACLACMREYATIRIYTKNLQTLEEQETQSLYRPPISLEEFSVRPTETCTVDELHQAFCRLLEEKQETKYVVEREELTLEMACNELLLEIQEGISFFQFFTDKTLSRKECIIFFLALLELIKQRKLLLSKKDDDIYIYGKKPLRSTS